MDNQYKSKFNTMKGELFISKTFITVDLLKCSLEKFKKHLERSKKWYLNRGIKIEYYLSQKEGKDYLIEIRCSSSNPIDSGMFRHNIRRKYFKKQGITIWDYKPSS